MEMDIPGFQTEYNQYRTTRDIIDGYIMENRHHRSAENLNQIAGEFQNLDVKIRLAFGIRKILLDANFVDEKEGDLKECHLLYYKLADLWFAYESFVHLLHRLTGKDVKPVHWISEVVHARFLALPLLAPALATVNAQLIERFGAGDQHAAFMRYLQYCQGKASGTQKTKRLPQVIHKVAAGVPLDRLDVVTIIYSIRNNFAHNGETTVVPDNFSFQNKGRLLKTLYPFLAIAVLSWVNLAVSEV